MRISRELWPFTVIQSHFKTYQEYVEAVESQLNYIGSGQRHHKVHFEKGGNFREVELII